MSSNLQVPSGTVIAPANGRVHPLADVPDPVFSAGMAGGGCAIWLDHGTQEIYAPATGTILRAMDHGCIIASGGMAILLHLGVDTVELSGIGISLTCAPGDEVRAGDLIGTWDTARAEEADVQPWVIIVAMDGMEGLQGVQSSGHVRPGDVLMRYAGHGES